MEDDFRIRSVLTISNVLPTDVGEYTCRLDNHDISGLPVVESIQITVNSKRIIIHSTTSPME